MVDSNTDMLAKNEEAANMYWIIDHDQLCWAPGKLFRVDGNELVVICINDGEYYGIEKAVAEEVHPSSLEGLPDLLSLGVFNEGALLHSVRTRYNQNQIYTSIGTPILLSVNPYQKLKIFTTSVARKYREYSRSIRSGGVVNQRPDPHLFMVAEESYQDMLIDNKNQSIIISGESGAGKTEATKIILCYLAKANTNFVSAVEEDMLDQRKYLVGENNIEKQVLDSNPLLEAFGNAKTFKNNNSSRFGKFIQVNFERSGKIHSASIVQYLLEKSRIVFQQGVERNFHIFYQLTKSQEQVAKYKLEPMQNYHYLNQSGTYQVNGVDDAEDYRMTVQCMENIGFSEQEINEVNDIVVSILNLGNIDFEVLTKSASGDQAQLAQGAQKYLENAAKFMQLTTAQLLGALTTKIQKIGKEVIRTQLTQAEAYNARDGMAKAVYGRLFKWIVIRINDNISKNMNAQKQGQSQKFIGLLDIFGFEIFKENSFEQMCINYANEKLQQHFNQHMFHMEQAEYSKEHIEWKQIPFVDNQLTIDLIESPAKPSLFKLLDEECMKKGTGNDKNLLKTYGNMLSGIKSFKRPAKFESTAFIIVHYAGAVEYEISGFLEKNTDTVSDICMDTLKMSSSSLISELFGQQGATGAAGAQQFGQVSAPQGGGLKGNTLSNQFRTQLNELIVTLKESSPRYIRCIKPNSNFSPTEFNSIDVCAQLKCAGMLEAIRIRKAGYAIRTAQDDFAKRYRAIIGQKKKIDAPVKQVCEMIMKEVLSYSQFRKIMDPALKRWQIGTTKVFMKEDVRMTLEQAMSVAVLGQARHIQRLWKGFKARKQFRLMKKSRKLINLQLIKYIRRRRLRKVIMAVVQRIKNALKVIQRVAKWKHRRMKIFKNVAMRIERKRLEAEKKKREEEQRIQKELELKQKKEEEELLKQQKLLNQQKQQEEQKQQNPGESGGVASNRISQNYNMGSSSSALDESSFMIGARISDLNESMFNENDISMQINKAGLPKAVPINQQNNNSNREGQPRGRDITPNSRFENNMNKLGKFIESDSVDAQKVKQLEEDLKVQVGENSQMRSQIESLRSTIEEKDREIRKLNLRLEARLKFGKETTGAGTTIDGSQQDMSFVNSSIFDDRMTHSQSQQHNRMGSEVDKLVESLEEEIHQMKIKNDGLEHELVIKEEALDAATEEVEELKGKSTKWRAKLDEEINRNAQTVASLTKQIKELQEKSYKLEIELKSQSNDFEKKQYKDQSGKLEELQRKIHEQIDQISDLEMAKMTLEDQMVSEKQKADLQMQDVKQMYEQLNDRYKKRMEELEKLEEQLVLKEEMAKQFEEDNIELKERVQMMIERMEDLGENRTLYEDSFASNSQTGSKLKELQRELERQQNLDKVRQAELARVKEMADKLKQKTKTLEEETDLLVDEVNKLKKVKAELENQLLLGGGGPNGAGGSNIGGANGGDDYEKQKLREKVGQQQKKLARRKLDLKRLDAENQFYNQTINIFTTIKRVIEKEKQYCFMFAQIDQNSDPVLKQQYMAAISLCRQKCEQLDQKLKQVLKESKRQQELLEQEALDN